MKKKNQVKPTKWIDLLVLERDLKWFFRLSFSWKLFGSFLKAFWKFFLSFLEAFWEKIRMLLRLIFLEAFCFLGENFESFLSKSYKISNNFKTTTPVHHWPQDIKSNSFSSTFPIPKAFPNDTQLKERNESLFPITGKTFFILKNF